MRKKAIATQCFCLVLTLATLPTLALAHFGAVIPDSPILDQSNRSTELTLAFLHPFEQAGMDLNRPEEFKVVTMTDQSDTDLTSELESATVCGHQAWKTSFSPPRPGVYCAVMQPQPYWEPAEDIFIKHITKTYLAAFGDESGWPDPLGLETEIVPLTRPFGLYAGNVFQGRVMMSGQPVAQAEVEVEYYNTSHARASSDHMVTQVVLADDNGVFTYAAPRPGWWGFSALNEAEYTLKHEGSPKNLELGAVIWVQFQPWQE